MEKYCPRCGTMLDSFMQDYNAETGRYKWTVSYCNNCGKSYKIWNKEFKGVKNAKREVDIQELRRGAV